MEIPIFVIVFCFLPSVLSQEGTVSLNGNIMVNEPMVDPFADTGADAFSNINGSAQGTFESNGMVLPERNASTDKTEVTGNQGQANTPVVDGGNVAATGGGADQTSIVGGSGGDINAADKAAKALADAAINGPSGLPDKSGGSGGTAPAHTGSSGAFDGSQSGGTGSRPPNHSAVGRPGQNDNRQGTSSNRQSSSSDRIVGGIGGGGFDKLSVERGACFSKCLRDRDSCYRPHNCTHYEHCYTSMQTLCPCTLRPCSFGTLWSYESEMCEIASTVFCQDDPCAKDVNKIAYPSGINCKSYYICSEGRDRRSLPMCCRDFHSFSTTELRCVPDEACGRIPCTVQSLYYDEQNFATTTLEPVKRECPLESYRSDPSKYNYKSFKLAIPMVCAPGTIFDETVCTCVTAASPGLPPVMRPCEELVMIDFDGGILENHNIAIPIYATDTQTVTTKEGAKYGRFNGRSSVIEIPYFEKPVKFLLARIRFYTDGRQGPDNQVLLSNCQSAKVDWSNLNEASIQQTTLSPSLAIILNRKLNKLTFLGSTGVSGAKPVVMQLPYKPNDWNNVELLYDGKNLQARNRVLSGGSKATEEDIKPLEGQLGTFRGALRIGSCDHSDGYFGYMDMIKIYECIPGRG